MQSLHANWVMGELFGALNKAGTDLADSPVSADSLGGLIEAISEGTISGRTVGRLCQHVRNRQIGGNDHRRARAQADFRRGRDRAALDEIIAANPAQVEKAKENPKLKGWFVGQVMKATGGQANPAVVNKLINQKLG